MMPTEGEGEKTLPPISNSRMNLPLPLLFVFPNCRERRGGRIDSQKNQVR